MARFTVDARPADVLAELGYPPGFGDWAADPDLAHCPVCRAVPGSPCHAVSERGTPLPRSLLAGRFHDERYHRDAPTPAHGTAGVSWPHGDLLVGRPGMARFSHWLVSELGLQARTYNCLRRAGIDTVGGLLPLTEQDLRDIRNFGEVSMTDVRRALARLDST